MIVNRKQLAGIRRVSVTTVIRWEEQEIIPSWKIGNVVRFDTEKVEKALKKFERVSGPKAKGAANISSNG